MAGLEGMTPIQRIKAIQGNNALALELPGNMRTASQPKTSNLSSWGDGMNTTVPTVSNTQIPSYSGVQGLTGSNTGLARLKNQSMAMFNPLGDSGQQYVGSDGSAVNLNYEQLDAINNPTQGSEGSGASGIGDYMGLANLGVNAFNAYNNYTLGKENLKMARDKFGFEKAVTNANYTNQAKLANNQIQNAGEVGMGLAGNTMDATARAARQAQMDASKVRETI